MYKMFTNHFAYTMHKAKVWKTSHGFSYVIPKWTGRYNRTTRLYLFPHPCTYCDGFQGSGGASVFVHPPLFVAVLTGRRVFCHETTFKFNPINCIVGELQRRCETSRNLRMWSCYSHAKLAKTVILASKARILAAFFYRTDPEMEGT